MFTQEIAYSTAYLAGVASFFSPCIFPIIPVYISILSNGEKKSLSKTLAFVLGLSVTYIVLGFGAGVIGDLFLNSNVRIIGGIIVVILGLFQMEVLKLKFLEKTKIMNYEGGNQSIFSTFLLGLTFSLGWTPCVGPILASILILASSSGDTTNSVMLMFIYLLGMATPFVIFSLTSKALFKKMTFIKKYLPAIKKVGGFLIIIMGLLLIFNKLNIFLTV
ncbi:cytochrome c biogenesis CcdA family protein [Fusobacterium nucleatum]|uniref:cytochrome c biogenesis CcdA family protein n=1 Tax=Fusobacterium nucleatum TaxID=851 RepID=UPI0004190180|nr:cytochrome c biogenesis CcdA family protein [Fusobacterium nucleatum]ALF24214.1 cytochrome C biogenesis protein CcdA [Fusobacterium nucleatum subsp. nucleatum ChDC F316]ASG26500.1 cytochrome C biogenesis protein CcdA [Fusobacterium nucleatum subsp. nucleatum]